MTTARDIVVRAVAVGLDLAEVLRTMEDDQIRRVPVIEDHRLVGVVSEADLARHLPEDRLAAFVERVYAWRSPCSR